MSDPKNSSRSATIPVRDPSLPLSSNKHLLKWIQKMVTLTQPVAIHWVDGSEEENTALCQQMVEGGTSIKLNEELWPGCYYSKSDPGDVARVEDRTFICSLSKDGAGPTNNWANPFEMRRKLKELFNGCMRGRTMYVLPFSMGHIGSPMSQIGVQLTDPMAMLPFCGYHMGDYFRHWINMQRSLSETPRVFHVNWFRKGEDGKFLWPGFGENMRVLKWIVERARGRALGKEAAVGWQPRYEDINWDGLDFPKEKFEELQRLDRTAWRREVIGHEELFLDLHDRLPKELIYERELLICRL
jgi:GTP-dependent phosphoenolpyruvate carboxykinase